MTNSKSLKEILYLLTHNAKGEWKTPDNRAVDKATKQLKQSLLEVIQSKRGEVIPYTHKQDNFATGYANAVKQITDNIEELVK